MGTSLADHWSYCPVVLLLNSATIDGRGGGFLRLKRRRSEGVCVSPQSMAEEGVQKTSVNQGRWVLVFLQEAYDRRAARVRPVQRTSSQGAERPWVRGQPLSLSLAVEALCPGRRWLRYSAPLMQLKFLHPVAGNRVALHRGCRRRRRSRRRRRRIAPV